MRISTRIQLLVLATLSAGCNSRHPELALSPDATIAMTGGPNTSLIYLARTDSGVIAIDLGWWGYRRPLSRALGRLQATPHDVRFVFLTHSHRDHIAAWREVRGARFEMSADERPRLLGVTAHRAWMVRVAEKLKRTDFPDSSVIHTTVFSRDTLIVLGRDTVQAYLMPGHTAGSVAYLFRGVLFIGDAATHSMLGGFKPAKPQFTDDERQAIASLQSLWRRVPSNQVRILCTAHAECAAFTPELVKRLGGK